jgi:hypothetical protein
VCKQPLHEAEHTKEPEHLRGLKEKTLAFMSRRRRQRIICFAGTGKAGVRPVHAIRMISDLALNPFERPIAGRLRARAPQTMNWSASRS